MWHAALGGPVSEHQADGHQCHGSGQVPPHAERQELLHPGLRGALRAASGRRGGHPVAPGCGAERGCCEHEIRMPEPIVPILHQDQPIVPVICPKN